MRAWSSPDVPRIDLGSAPPVRIHDSAARAAQVSDPRRHRPDVRLRHHAVRRHAPRPRRDVRRLRPAQPGLARRRPRRALRPERHRRRRPAARAGHRDRRRLARARRARDRAVPRRHDGPAGARPRRTTSARSSRSRSSSRWSSSCRSAGAVVRRRRRPLLLGALRPARSARCRTCSDERDARAVRPSAGETPSAPGKKDPLDCLLWQAERPGEPAWDTALGPRPSRAGTSSARRSRCTTSARSSTSRAAAATWSSRTTR